MSLGSGKIAIVGATGAVGAELIQLLHDEGVEPDRIVALASARSAGTSVVYGDASITVSTLDDADPSACALVFLAASSGVARAWAPRFVDGGALVVDNSSAFRMDPNVPLVVPETNADAIGDARLIANPNCSTIIMLVPATPLRRRFGCRKLIVSTYQAVSGAGAPAMEELRSQTERVLSGDEASPELFAEPCAFNVFSHDTPVDADTGLNVEEQKMIDETRKMWGDPEVDVCPTCIRVPVMRAHAESIHMTLAEPATEAEVRETLDAALGLDLLDDRTGNMFPTSLKASGRHNVLVGRVRPDPATRDGDRYLAYQMFVAGDQILKGAALNALQIARLAISRS
ncbi:MAG: aspartate-semialdehyde dehydrogenase [Planctomycetota bacterium]